ncbi:MAG: pseudouridine synthase [Burkholderiaceae bacterium]
MANEEVDTSTPPDSAAGDAPDGEGRALRTAFNRRRTGRGRRSRRGGKKDGALTDGVQADDAAGEGGQAASSTSADDTGANSNKPGGTNQDDANQDSDKKTDGSRRRSRSRGRRRSGQTATESGAAQAVGEQGASQPEAGNAVDQVDPGNSPGRNARGQNKGRGSKQGKRSPEQGKRNAGRGRNSSDQAPPRELEPVEPLPEIEIKAEIGVGQVNAEILAEVPDDFPKLHKVLADAGLGSRREMEELIISGRISVNGQPAHIGQRVGPKELVRVNGRPIKRKPLPPPPRVLLYNKPAGEICTRDDPEKRPTVFERLPNVKGGRWISAGRLDFNTEGLMIFSTSGDIANKLMHPRYGWEREYAVRVMGRIDDESRQSLLDGIDLADGTAQVLAIEDLGGDNANAWYRLVIGEGRNREVRRIMEAIGLTVSRLVRIRFGPIALPRKLARGRWMELSRDETAVLNQSVRRAAAEAAAIDPSGARLAGDPDDADAMPDELSTGIPSQDDDDGFYPFAADSYFADEEDFPDDAQPVHLFEEVDVDPRFARVSAEQLDDENWQPSGDDAHEDGMVRHVVEQVAAMKTPGMSRRAQQRASQISWAGGPMDSASGEDGMAAMGPNGRGSGRRKSAGNKSGNGSGAKRGGKRGGSGAGGRKGGGNRADGAKGRGGSRKSGSSAGGNSAAKSGSGNKSGNSSRRRSRGPKKSTGGGGNA